MSKAIDLTFRCAKENETKYAFTQSQQIKMQTGYVGYLRGDFGINGNNFYFSWNDEIDVRKTPEFQSEFDNVINALRDDPKYRGILRNREDMKLLCCARPQSRIESDERSDMYCFRADTKKYSYIIRCQTHSGDYNFYVTAYEKDYLDRHIKNAEKDIRFITSNYQPLFTLPDGSKIKITMPNGNTLIRTCRYIDEYHLEVGNILYHICEFAERMEMQGNKVEPIDDAPKKERMRTPEFER